MTLATLLLLAQVAPGVFTTVKSTSTASTSMCVGCPTANTTPAANSGLTARTIVLPVSGAPSDTTNKIYQVGGALFFNGLSLATGSSISGTTGTVPKFTAATTLGDSNITISGSAVSIAGTLAATSFTGTVATSNLSGNYVATVASGTGITSSVTTGTGAATSISLNNTAVTPSTYGSSTAMSVFTVDQQGRITSATTATPQLTLTSTYFSSLSGTALTGVALLASANSFSGNQNSSFLQLNSNASTSTASIAGWSSAAGSTTVNIEATSQGFTTSGPLVQAGGAIRSNGVGGLSLAAIHASGAIRFYTGGTTLRWGINSAGDHTFGASEHIADSSGTPAINSGFGASSTITGSDYAFTIVTVNANTGGIVGMGHTFTNNPVCNANFSDPTHGVIGIIATSTSTVSLSYASVSSENISVHCRGY